jgi:hypothetical protein
MQAIQTKYIGPSNTKGSRISVTAMGNKNRIYVPYDHEHDEHKMHEVAMKKFLDKYDWPKGKWAQGGTENGYVFVHVASKR